jgi:flagellar hook-associated protein 1
MFAHPNNHGTGKTMTSLLNALNAGKNQPADQSEIHRDRRQQHCQRQHRGYSRQRAELSQIPAVNFGDFFIGQG